MKRFYVVLLSVFIISAVLLGLSYSKDAGQFGVPEIGQIVDDKYRVVYSTSDYLTPKNLGTDVGIINKTKDELNYVIKLIPELGKDITYSINGSEYKLLEDRNIFAGKLSEFGTEGDFALNKIKIKCIGNCNVKVEVKTNDKEYLKDVIINDDNVYNDNGVYRYYGEEVKNYVKFDGTISRIVKYQDNKVFLISDPSTLGAYKVDGSTYLELNDYLSSFNKEMIKEEEILQNKSWLTIDEVYWLESDGRIISANDSLGIEVGKEKDVHYIRGVKAIDDSNLIISKGDGSLSNPYEVSYGSK